MSEIKCGYVLKVESLGDCAGVVKIVFVGDTPYITDVERTYGSFNCYIDLEPIG